MTAVYDYTGSVSSPAIISGEVDMPVKYVPTAGAADGQLGTGSFANGIPWQLTPMLTTPVPNPFGADGKGAAVTPVTPATVVISGRSIGVSSAFAAVITSFTFPFGGVVITHTDGTMTQYPAATDTDIARGNALWAAVQAVQANEDMDLSAKVFNIGDNGTRQINLARTGGSWRIHGNGKLLTTIQASAGNNNIITFAANSQTTDMTLLCSDPNSIMGGWGVFDVNNVAPPDYSNIWLYNISIVGQSDAILIGFDDFFPAHLTVNIVNTSMSTKWDCHHIDGVGATSVINWYNCDATAIADENQPGSVGDARCYLLGLRGTFNLYGCTAYASDFPDTGNEIAFGLFLGGDGTAGTRANLYGGIYKAVRNQGGSQPRPTKEISLVQNTLVSNTHIYATPSVVWDNFLDTSVPNQGPSGLTEISWTAPSLPARPYLKPVILIA